MSELLDAVDDLTLPKPVKVQTDDGHTWATEDALLVQLEEAIHSTTGRSGGRSASHTRMILDADALMQFHRITSTIGDWCRMAGAAVTRDPVHDLRAWYAAILTSPDSTEFYLHELTGWASLIRGKLTPRSTLEWLKPCPECNADEYVNEEGDTVRHPVVIDYDPDTPFASVRWTCRACGESRAGEFAQRALAYDGETRGEDVNDNGVVLP
ncbi:MULTISPECIES: hypothetical protein [unclassified Microbacterium]|uniref:DUF7341 domain-containing protein n=1 Tax=unclassified Microbacterium TaxID=2609290 RepID=UPI000EA9C83D|nr:MULTISPECIES: hypothetical protein [unclassified Microbacterium]MBT2485798.1 hypothetical protein [Microbacterium sp. ISL-108]RKN68560.1 hypothetical protein D7252_13860 [Microbacterium sp. CGR2]